MNESINLETILLSIKTVEAKENIISSLQNSALLDEAEIALINEYFVSLLLIKLKSAYEFVSL